MKIFPIKALKDNYIWCLHSNGYCAIIDPGESFPVINVLQKKGLILSAILVTHHHHDHTNGITGLLSLFNVPVIGPKEIQQVTLPLQVEQSIHLDYLGVEFDYFCIPGHTLEHVAYYCAGVVFTGDTLFTAGCGRIFEGSVEQMYHSLEQLKSLPDNTLVYCGHEYTENNLRFALRVEPNNIDINNRLAETINLRKKNLPTVPASLAIEKRTNPFLRCDHHGVINAASKYDCSQLTTPVDVLRVLREWKNSF